MFSHLSFRWFAFGLLLVASIFTPGAVSASETALVQQAPRLNSGRIE